MEKVDESFIGAHHLDGEAIACTIAMLRNIEAGTYHVDIDDMDWRTTCGVLALQMEFLFKKRIDG